MSSLVVFRFKEKMYSAQILAFLSLFYIFYCLGKLDFHKSYKNRLRPNSAPKSHPRSLHIVFYLIHIWGREYNISIVSVLILFQMVLG